MNGLIKDNIFAVCVSLVLHLLAAALLSGLVDGGLSHAFAREKVSFFWVSIEHGDESASRINGATPRTTAPMADVQSAVAMPSDASANPHTQTFSNPEPAVMPVRNEAFLTTRGAGLSSGETLQTSAGILESASGFGEVPGAHEGGAASGRPDLPSSALPLYRENTPPPYPEIARVRDYQGIVLVEAEVLPDGTVGRVKIKKSSGYSILDQTAIKAVKPWRFQPAVKEGRPFAVWVELPIKFQLRDSSSI
jgi:protein TonB